MEKEAQTSGQDIEMQKEYERYKMMKMAEKVANERVEQIKAGPGETPDILNSFNIITSKNLTGKGHHQTLNVIHATNVN